MGLALFLTHGAWDLPHSDFVGSSGDAPQNAWYLAWMAFAVSHGTDPLLITYLSPPGHPLGLMWQDAAPLLGLLLAPVTFAYGGAFAYNLGVTLGLALSAWSAYLTLGAITRHHPPAWIGGLVFGFSPWVLGEAADGHLFLVNLWLIPPFFFFLARVLLARRMRVASSLALGVVAAAQLLVSQEILGDCILVGTLLVIGASLADWRRLRQRWWPVGRGICLAIATFGVVAGGPLAVAFLGPGHGLHGSLESPYGFYDDPLALVVPKSPLLLTAPSVASLASGLAPGFGPTLYIGLPLLLIVVWASWHYRSDRWVRGAALIGAASVVLALGPELTVAGVRTSIPLPWALLVHLPLLAVMVPDRIGIIAYLAGAAVLALVLDRQWPVPMDARVARPAVLALVAVLPLVPAGPLPRWIVPTPGFFTTPGLFRHLPQGSEVAVAGPDVRYNVDAMQWQADAGFWFRLPWGYAISAGPHGRRIVVVPDGALGALWASASAGAGAPVTLSVRTASKADICGWGVRAVIVGPMQNRSLVVDATSALIGQRPTWRGGVAIWLLPAKWCGRRAGPS